MAARKVETQTQINQLVALLETECKKLPRQEGSAASQESLLTFKNLEMYPLIVQQQAFEVRWEHTDALCTFPDSQAAYIMDSEVFIQWSSEASITEPQAFRHHDSTTLAPFHTLMLSFLPLCHAETAAGMVSPNSSGEMVFSAVVVFIRPRQYLLLIQEGVDLLWSHKDSSVQCRVLCLILEKGVGEFYPCLMYDTTLVLPVRDSEDSPMLHLDIPARASHEFVVRRLHRLVRPCGPLAVLPLIYNTDVGLPNVYPLEKLVALWTNQQYWQVGAPSSDLCYDQQARS